MTSFELISGLKLVIYYIQNFDISINFEKNKKKKKVSVIINSITSISLNYSVHLTIISYHQTKTLINFCWKQDLIDLLFDCKINFF